MQLVPAGRLQQFAQVCPPGTAGSGLLAQLLVPSCEPSSCSSTSRPGRTSGRARQDARRRQGGAAASPPSHERLVGRSCRSRRRHVVGSESPCPPRAARTPSTASARDVEEAARQNLQEGIGRRRKPSANFLLVLTVSVEPAPEEHVLAALFGGSRERMLPLVDVGSACARSIALWSRLSSLAMSGTGQPGQGGKSASDRSPSCRGSPCGDP